VLSAGFRDNDVNFGHGPKKNPGKPGAGVFSGRKKKGLLQEWEQRHNRCGATLETK